jgi:hypothetical protein
MRRKSPTPKKARKKTRQRPALAVAPGVEVSSDGEVITIDGMRYARSLFRHLADEAKIGTLFRLANNRDGLVTVQLAHN